MPSDEPLKVPWAKAGEDPVSTIPKAVKGTAFFKQCRKEHVANGCNSFLADVKAAEDVWERKGPWE